MRIRHLQVPFLLALYLETAHSLTPPVVSTKILQRSTEAAPVKTASGSSGTHPQPQLQAQEPPQAQPQEQQVGELREARSNPRKAYTLLRNVGTTIFRPGGTKATQQLHKWSQLTPEETCLEMSTGLGASGMALAKSRNCPVVLSIDSIANFPGRYQMARKRGVEHLVDKLIILEPNSPGTALEGMHFDAVLLEGTLTQVPMEIKRQILKELRPHTDQVLIHSVCLRELPIDNDTDTDSSHFYPLTEVEWLNLLEECGYQIQKAECGPLAFSQKHQRKTSSRPEMMALAKNLLGYLMCEPWRETALAAKEALMQDNAEQRLGYMLLQGTPVRPCEKNNCQRVV